MAAINAARPSLADTASASATNTTLYILPTEVLSHVWVHLDQPASFARASKHLRALSQDTLWRAKWFMQRYELYEVMFEALARPAVFTSALFHQLLLLKAPCSVDVVQLLCILHNETSRAALAEPGTLWGRISISAYAAVLEHAAGLSAYFGQPFTLQPRDFASVGFSHWLHKQGSDLQYEERRVQIEWVRNLFAAGFMPLKLSVQLTYFEQGFEGCMALKREDDVLCAIVSDPALLVPAMKNGYVLTFERMQTMVTRWCARHDPNKVMLEVQTLQIDGYVPLMKRLAQETFAAELKSREFFKRGDRKDADRLRELCDMRTLLLSLDAAHALPFSLRDVLAEIPSLFALVKRKVLRWKYRA